MIVSVHIPKTAGTFIGLMLDLAVGRRIFYDYLGEAEPLPPYFQESRRFFDNYFKVVHGHFHLGKYYGLFEEPFYLTSVRRPVDRIVSQFNHILLDPHANDYRRQEIQSGKMDIVAFASDPNIGNGQAAYLRDGIDKLSYVFVAEEMGKSIALFNLLHTPALLGGAVLDYASASTLKVNTALARPGTAHVPSARELEAMAPFTRADDEIYQAGLSRQHALLKAHGGDLNPPIRVTGDA